MLNLLTNLNIGNVLNNLSVGEVHTIGRVSQSQSISCTREALSGPSGSTLAVDLTLTVSIEVGSILTSLRIGQPELNITLIFTIVDILPLTELTNIGNSPLNSLLLECLQQVECEVLLINSEGLRVCTSCTRLRQVHVDLLSKSLSRVGVNSDLLIRVEVVPVSE